MEIARLLFRPRHVALALSAALLVAGLALASTASAAGSLAARFNEIRTPASAVAANGDVNSDAVAAVPESAGRLTAGDVAHVHTGAVPHALRRR